MALVSVHKTERTSDTSASIPKNGLESDPDLKRAKELVDLHYGMKLKYRESGLDQDLLQARRNVESVKRSLG